MNKYAVFNGPDWVRDVEADTPIQAIQEVKAAGDPADRAELISKTEDERSTR